MIGFKFVFVSFSLLYIEGFVCKLFASEVSDYWGNVIVFKFLFVSFSLLYIDGLICELLASEVGVVLARLYSIIADRQRMKDNKCGSRWGNRGSGPPPPLENYKKLGCLSNTGPDPLKITKLPSLHSMLGHHRPTSETPFKWRFAGGPLTPRL